MVEVFGQAGVPVDLAAGGDVGGFEIDDPVLGYEDVHAAADSGRERGLVILVGIGVRIGVQDAHALDKRLELQSRPLR